MYSREQQIATIRQSTFFDADFYVQTYSDVALLGTDPAEHYLTIGGNLGRKPGPSFDGAAYLARYRDVARTGQNPLLHFEMWGRGEGRSPNPDAPPEVDPLRVDVVVPVFNARDDVEACLRSLADAETGFDVRVLVINDGSEDETSTYLRRACPALSRKDMAFELIEHEDNKGYTVAVNTGLKASHAAYVATLNSDTIVTRGWLDGLVAAATGEVGITGPLSNAASWQNTPVLMAEDGSGFAINALPKGMTPDAMAELVRRASCKARPLTTFLNGFCFLIRRDVLDAVGYMDEASFPFGYGEENDFCLRAQDAGFKLAIADDVYVFHSKSKSFGHQRRAELSKAGSVAIRKKHGNAKFDAKVKAVANLKVMDIVRKRVSRAIADRSADLPTTTLDFLGTQKVLFLLPVRGGGGGAHSVVQEATAMMRIGINVKIAVQDADFHNFMELYGDIPEATRLFIGFRAENVVATAQSFDVVVATLFSSVVMLERITASCPWILPAYYIQDYEPMFFDEGSENWHIARDSYTRVPSAVLMAKTDWICQTVEREHGVRVNKIEPSIDHEIYRPSAAPRPADRPTRICAMVRPQTPRRGPGRTMELLAGLKARFGKSIDVHIFGCDSNAAGFAELRQDFDFTNHGVLKRPEVAALLNGADIFVDLSDYQAFGRTSLEAMASGTLAVVPEAGGGDEYAVHGVNALVVDSFDVSGAHAAISDVLSDPARMTRMRMLGLRTASLYSPHRAALSELMTLAPALAKRRAASPAPERPRVTLLPALNSGHHVTIAGSGYVRLLCPYRQDDLMRDWSVGVLHDGDVPLPGSADIAILQRDMLLSDQWKFGPWVKEWKEKGGKLIYEIDDDLMNPKALYDRGYSGNAEDLAERVRRYTEAADLITVSTPHLATLFSHYADKVEVVPNYIDARLWQIDRDLPDRGKSNRPLVVGYVGTPTHTEDLRIIEEAVKSLEAEGLIQVEVIGAFQRINPLFGKRIGLPQNSVYPIFTNWLKKIAKWDIAVVPLEDTSFNRAKSNLKFIESAALGVAVLCTNNPEYSRVVRHEENGLLVENTTEAWRAAITRVAKDDALRERLARTAYHDVRSSLTVQANRALYDRVLRRALGMA